jgi:hypothetical protein
MAYSYACAHVVQVHYSMYANSALPPHYPEPAAFILTIAPGDAAALKGRQFESGLCSMESQKVHGHWQTMLPS